MDKLHCPSCHGDKVTTIGDNLLCLTCGYQEYLYDYRNAFDEGRAEDTTEIDTLKERVDDLDTMVAEPGRIPRKYNDKLQQLQGEVAYIRNKVNELQSKQKPRGQY